MAVTHDPDLLSDDRAELLRTMLEHAHAQATTIRPEQLFYTYFADDGPFSRAKYAKHMEFFAAGAEFPERMFLAGNRIGKTVAGAFEVTCHLTGKYPNWWVGKRFYEPVEWWACGTTSETTRDIVQAVLLGTHDKLGTGMIPAQLILSTSRRPHGLPGSIESAYIQHSTGGKSLLGLKTYEQGRKSFEGTGKHGIWDDEEPPMDVYQEQLIRTLTTKGIMFVTFTPLQGMSEVVTSYLEPPTDAAREVKMYVQAGWDDVPHLDEREKKRQLATMLPYQIAARTKGEPTLGSGAIYALPESDVKVKAFHVPWTWPRGYGLDVGWNRTAAGFFTQEIGTGIYYLYDEHYMSAGEPASHAMGIRARGEFLVGAIDPAANGRSQEDGRRLIDSYQALGLNLVNADHAVEAGIMDTWTLLISGRLKVFDKCENWFREFRKYHRDEAGKIVKGNDHAMDACFTADVEVLTSDGPRRIADLVGHDGIVLSRDGATAKYMGARKTLLDVPVVRVEFDDGHSVSCTPDHPFLTPHGWQRADHLVGEDCYNAIAQRILWHPHASRYCHQPVKSFWAEAITSAASIFSAMASAYIAWCGRLRTGLFLAGFISTTAMKTGPITNSEICVLKRPDAIRPIISVGTRARSRHKPERPPRDGIGVLKDDYFTESTTPNTRPSSSSAPSSPAISAALSSWLSNDGSTDSALTPARPNLAWRLAWTIRNAVAWSAARCSWLIATTKNRSARAAALVRVVSVTDAGHSDVYCLTVPGLSAFTLANGVVVHNTRYWVKSGRDHMKVKPKTALERDLPSLRKGRTWMGS